MATVTYNGQVITQLQGGRTGVIDFADEKMYTDITVEGAEDTEVRYKGAVLAKGRKVIIHCAGKIMRGEMRIAAAGRLKLDAPVIRISQKLKAPTIYIGDGNTTSVLGMAVLGMAVLGRGAAILGEMVLGSAVLGLGNGLAKLDAPIIELVNGEKLDTPVISLYKDNQLDAPVIYLQTEDDLIKLDAPVIYLETDSELIKLDTPTIYIETEDVPEEPEMPKLTAPEIYLEIEPEVTYKEVEYLESTGTQWIDIGTTVVTATDEIELCFEVTETALYKWFFGEYDTDARLGLGSGDGANKRNFLYKSSATKINDTDMYGKQHTYLISPSGGFIDGVKKASYASFASTSTLYLFNINIDSQSDYRCKARVWGYKQKRNGVLIRDLIPVLDMNNVPCMYDKVSGEFFYNAGTGEFLYAEKEPEIIKLDAPVIYIEAEAIPKLDAPEIYLESDPVVPDEPETSGVTWNKYNCNTTTIYDQTDAYVGDTGSHTVWDGQGLFTAYAFSEEEGFYYPDGFDHYVVYEDASQAAGAYTLQNNEGDVYVESGVWQLGAIIEVHDQYDRKGYTYETTCVASADAHYFYSKGNTLIGTVEAAEGEKPASGEVLDSGNGWYIIRTTDGIYYYEREV